MNFTTLTLRDAIAQELLTSLATDLDMLEDGADSLIIRIYEGNTIINEYVDLHDLFYEQKIAGIIVNGNLTVNAPIIDFEIDTYSSFLIVHGSLTCKTLAAGCAEIIIDGDVTVADAMVAFYNHGTIEIQGDLNARLLIIDDHGASIKGRINAATYCRGWHIKGANYTNWRHILLPEVADELLDEKDYLFAGDVRLLNMLKDEKPVFRDKLGDISAANNPEAKIVSWETVKPMIQHLECKYEAYPFAIAEKREPGLPDDRFLLYNGTTVLDELDLDTEDYMSIIVVGDLHVKGSIINENTDGACSLIVLGNLKAKNVCVGGQIIYINGYIAVEEMLMGIYNHGELYSTSYVWCPVVIADDYSFYFPDYANVKVLELYDQDDNDLIKEKLIGELFDEEEGFLLYSTIREGVPLLKQQEQLTSITKEALEAIINAPLLGPDNYKVAFDEDDWYITLDRGGEIDADGNASPSSVIAINLDKGKYYFWYLSEDGTIATMIKEGEDWIMAPPEAATDILEHFSLINRLINRKVRWNNKYVQNINQEELWKLVWMFRNGQEETVFQASAITICRRVLYAAAYPFAYIFARYKEDSEHRGLAGYPSWAPAAALLDGLIQWELAQEITRNKPLAEKSEELDIITNYNWGVAYQIPEQYNTKPIDKDFMIELNADLAAREGAILRLDAGIGSFVIAGMHVNDLDILNDLMHPLGIYPKYFTVVDKEEEDALKEIADALLTAASDEDPLKLQPYREYQATIWNYAYNELGDVVFWQNWMETLQSRLTNQAGSSYIFRGESHVAPIHPEFDHWINWCEKYKTIAEGSHIILPEEEA
ncbi:hypothetical protein [Chitinophaga ginsengisoli]|uniref:Uncharacterized protein n=1 Tax=Chitinophaga ginsengisoli TaxID=363837 RepID=A0A2P8GKH8_9BACT|nr:hypothetical protein [Chitinophaga ginsengisoli]PSL34478.1 hypothetical protein CLV42_10249 [Chitinophaga ginsengisoli]